MKTKTKKRWGCNNIFYGEDPHTLISYFFSPLFPRVPLGNIYDLYFNFQTKLKSLYIREKTKKRNVHTKEHTRIKIILVVKII